MEILQTNAWVIPVFIILGLLHAFTPIIRGKIGEGKVNLAAKLWLDSNVYQLLKDVTIPTAKGGTSQIDHIFLSIYGIFVVETKNYSGWIFGTAKDRQWTQVNYKKKNRFQNPLRQNHGHICALSELLGIPKSKFHNVVCFMGNATFKTGIPEGVCLAGSYVTHVKSFKQPTLSKKELVDIREQLDSGRLKRGFKTNRQHVRNLQQRHSAKSPKKTAPATEKLHVVTGQSASNTSTCSRCGSPMVLRTARKGKNAGSQFWGCSGYPNCRYTIATK